MYFPSMATFIRCGYFVFVRKCRFSSTTSGGNVGHVVPCDAADGTGDRLDKYLLMVGRGFDAKYVCSDEFKLNLNIACHSGTRLYCRSYHMNKKIIKKSSQDEIISYHIT